MQYAVIFPGRVRLWLDLTYDPWPLWANQRLIEINVACPFRRFACLDRHPTMIGQYQCQ